MKRRYLEKRIREAAKKAGVEMRIEEGGSHSKLWLDDQWTTLPRHNEIDEHLAIGIFKQVQGKLGEGKLGEKWWR